jgi:hypothetical protein
LLPFQPFGSISQIQTAFLSFAIQMA